MADTLLKDFVLLDPRDGCIRSGMQVLLRDGRIADVSDGRIEARGATVVGLGGRTLMPGLVDCHVHVNAVQVKLGLAATRHIPASLVTAAASEIMHGMLMRGFTSVRDAGGADRGLREAVERGLFRGPRLFISGRAISQTGGHGDFRERVDLSEPCGCGHMLNGIGRIADGVAQVQQAVRDEIRLGADQIKVMASGGVASAADPIHFLQYSKAELEAIVDEAARADIYVMAHAYTPAAIRRAIEAGIRTIEHGNIIDGPTAALMAERNAYLVPTLVTFHALAKHGRELGFPEESLEKLEKIMRVGTESLRIAKVAGVKMAYGTDLLGELHRYQSDEFRIRSEVFSPLELIQSATIVGAEVLRMEGQIGVIAPGAHADLLAIDGNPLDDLSLLQDQGAHIPIIINAGKFAKNTLSL